MRKLIQQFGGWPVLERGWPGQGAEAYKWERQAGELRLKTGVEGPISMFIYVDMKDSEKEMITVSKCATRAHS